MSDPISTLGIDSNLQVGTLKKSHAPCRRIKFSLTPDSNTSYTLGETIRFTLPTRANTFMVNPNCYLKFKVTNNHASVDAVLDHTINSCIERIEEFSSGNLLSSLSNYGTLFHTMYDAKYSFADTVGHSNFNGQLATYSSTTGAFLSNSQGTNLTAAGGSRTYAIPIMSPVFGVLLDKYFPLFACSGGDLRLEITLATAVKAFYSAGIINDSNIVISEMSFEMELLELSGSAMQMVGESMGSEGIILHSTGFRDHVGSINTGSSGTQVHLVNARYSSLKSLITCYLNQENIYNAYATNSRIKPQSSYQLRINSSLVPQRPITDDCQFFLETMLSLHNDPASLFNKGQLSRSEYLAVDGDNDGPTSYANKHFVSIPLDSVHGRDSLLMSGVNTLNNPMFTEIILAATTTKNLRVINYAEFDMIIQIENGIAKVRF